MPPFLYPFWWSDVSCFQRQCCCWCFKALSPCLWLNPLSFAAEADETTIFSPCFTMFHPHLRYWKTLLQPPASSHIRLYIFAGLAGFNLPTFGVLFQPQKLWWCSPPRSPRLRVWRAPPPRSTVRGSRSAARSPRDGPGRTVGGPIIKSPLGAGRGPRGNYSNWLEISPAKLDETGIESAQIGIWEVKLWFKQQTLGYNHLKYSMLTNKNESYK